MLADRSENIRRVEKERDVRMQDLGVVAEILGRQSQQKKQLLLL